MFWMRPSSESNTPRLLEMRGVDKSFAGVVALRDVSLRLERGEVLALVGENGAGKSTLIKVLGGAHRPDRGEILLDGRPVAITKPTAAARAGIAIIYQELNLVGHLSVCENIFLGREPTRWRFIAAEAERRAVAELFGMIGAKLDPDVRCRDLSVPQQQIVEIAKALSTRARIVVMDEPTAALTAGEVEKLLAVIRDLKAHGLGVIYISHRLDEIFAVADRVMVLRDGRLVGENAIGDVTREQLIEMMVGRPLEQEFPQRSAVLGNERLRVEGLSRSGVVHDVSFAVRGGEILGVAGLAGAGRTETARLVFGADRADRGRILVNGREVAIRTPRDAIRHRICLLTEDRKGQGLVLIHSVQDNFGLPNLAQFRWGPLLDRRRERAEFNRYAQLLKLRTTGPDQTAAHLSGGNQQKVVLAKWLAQGADVVIFDEPTRGIDVGAKYEIYLLINSLAEQGKAIVMISSEIPELLGMSDRIVVMHNGRVRGEIADVAAASQEDVLEFAMT